MILEYALHLNMITCTLYELKFQQSWKGLPNLGLVHLYFVNFPQHKIFYLESSWLDFKVEVSGSASLVGSNSQLWITSFFLKEIKLASLQEVIIILIIIFPS